jgi:hypothetical protein
VIGNDLVIEGYSITCSFWSGSITFAFYVVARIGSGGSTWISPHPRGAGIVKDGYAHPVKEPMPR